jgi:hypothetical protein
MAAVSLIRLGEEYSQTLIKELAQSKIRGVKCFSTVSGSLIAGARSSDWRSGLALRPRAGCRGADGRPRPGDSSFGSYCGFRAGGAGGGGGGTLALAYRLLISQLEAE